MRKIGLIISFAAMLLLMGSATASAQAMDPNPLKLRTGADFDLYFMRNIITNHQIDIELLRPAPPNASHSEIRTLALSVMNKRQQEAEQLIGWLNDWYHNQPDTSMTATLIHMKAMPSMDMGSLNEGLHQIYTLQAATGDAYDRNALIYLIHDHQLAIEAAQLAPDRAARPELKPFAQNLIGEEQGEIDQFTAWLGQWYQVDAAGQPLPNPPTVAASPTGGQAPLTPTTASAPVTPTSPSPTNTTPPPLSPSSNPPPAVGSAATATPVVAPANPIATNSASGLMIVVIGAVVIIALVALVAIQHRPRAGLGQILDAK